MYEVTVKQCVVTILSLRGKGIADSPFRRIVEVWDAQTGEKIAEDDCHFHYSPTEDKYISLEND